MFNSNMTKIQFVKINLFAKSKHGPTGTLIQVLQNAVIPFSGNYLSNQDDNTALLQKREDMRGDLKAKLTTKREAFSFLVKKSEYDEQGVVCECCYHKCRFRELTDYCANGGGRMTFDFFKKRSQNSDVIVSGNSDDYSGNIHQPRRNDNTENNIDNERDLDKFTPP